MIRFYFPQNTDEIQTLYDEQALKSSLFMLAKDESRDVLSAVCQFFYQRENGEIRSIKLVDDTTELRVLDGLFRSVMFHMMEMDCRAVKITNTPDKMDSYFKTLGFEQTDDGWRHDNFEKLLFTGCCGGTS